MGFIAAKMSTEITCFWPIFTSCATSINEHTPSGCRLLHLAFGGTVQYLGSRVSGEPPLLLWSAASYGQWHPVPGCHRGSLEPAEGDLPTPVDPHGSGRGESRRFRGNYEWLPGLWLPGPPQRWARDATRHDITRPNKKYACTDRISQPA